MADFTNPAPAARNDEEARKLLRHAYAQGHHVATVAMQGGRVDDQGSYLKKRDAWIRQYMARMPVAVPSHEAGAGGDLWELERLSKADEALPEMRPIEWAPNYMAGADGNIWTFHNWRGLPPRPLKYSIGRDGYYDATLTTGRNKASKRKAHRIICEAWHGAKVNRQHQVRHLDGNKYNNRPDNLAWGTAKENAEDRDRHGMTPRGEVNAMSKLSDKDVAALVRVYRLGASTYSLAALVSVSPSTIINWATGTYRHARSESDHE